MLALASHTGWSCAEILAMRTGRFVWWLEGLAKGE
nr:MAG TPA: hypothetical protein [Caudoviricetes sp.]